MQIGVSMATTRYWGMCCHTAAPRATRSTHFGNRRYSYVHKFATLV